MEARQVPGPSAWAPETSDFLVCTAVPGRQVSLREGGCSRLEGQDRPVGWAGTGQRKSRQESGRTG